MINVIQKWDTEICNTTKEYALDRLKLFKQNKTSFFNNAYGMDFESWKKDREQTINDKIVGYKNTLETAKYHLKQYENWTATFEQELSKLKP